MLRPKFLLFVWPVLSGLLLAPLCLHSFWSGRAAHLTGDFCSHLLYQSYIGLYVILLLWQVWRGGAKRLLWRLPAVALASSLCVLGLKDATHLPRPDGEPSGFPSGHTTFSFALAWLLTQIYPRAAPLWYGVAVSIGWSRVEGGAHFPYQVLCGALFGTLIGWGVSAGIRDQSGRHDGKAGATHEWFSTARKKN